MTNEFSETLEAIDKTFDNIKKMFLFLLVCLVVLPVVVGIVAYNYGQQNTPIEVQENE